MRILYLTAFYPPDFSSGATIAVQRLAERAARAGHDVHVFSGAIERGLDAGAIAIEVVNGVTVHWIGSRTWLDPAADVNWSNPDATTAADRLLAEIRPDVVHAHTLQTLGAGPVAAALDRGIRTLVTMHDAWWWCALLFLVDRDLRPCTIVTDVGTCPCARNAPWRTARAAHLRSILDRVHEVLVPSQVMRDLVVANGVAPSRVVVDPNDIETVPREHAVDLAAVASPHGTTRFVFIGGDHPLKGTDVLLSAATRLPPGRGWSLTMYGVDARRDRAKGPVRFEVAFEPARRDEVLAAADVLVLASIARESYSLAAREALAAGLAVITTDCLGPEEVVHDGQNGLVIPAGDVEALAAAMRSLIEDRALLAALRKGAQASAVQLRSPDDHAAALLARYRTPVAAEALRTDDTLGTVVFVTGGTAGDRRARAERGAEGMALQGYDAVLCDAADPETDATVTSAELVIVEDLAATPRLAAMIDAARRTGTTVLYDTPDAGFAAGPTSARRIQLMSSCDGVLAPTPVVARLASETAGRRAIVVRDGVGVEEIRTSERLRSTAHRRHRLFTRGLTLTTVVDPSLEPHWPAIEPLLSVLLERHRDWRLQVLGDIGHHRGLDRFGRRVRHETLHDWRSLPARLTGADVVVAPFAGAADHLDTAVIGAWLDASLAGVPVAAISGGDVAAVIEDGVTGMLARHEREWITAVESVLEDRAVGARLAGAARRRVLLHHGPHTTARQLVDAFSVTRTWHDHRDG